MAALMATRPEIAVHIPEIIMPPGSAVQNTDNIPPIIVDIINFANRNCEKIERIDDFDGGWEGWLQVELADLLIHGDRALSKEYYVERELTIYKNPLQRIDLFCKSNKEFFDDNGICMRCQSGDSNHPRIGIELKAGNSYKDHWTGTSNGLPRRILEDIKQIEQVDDAWTKTCGARIFAVAIALEPGNLYGQYMKVQEYSDVPVQYAMTESRSCFVLWWYKDFPRDVSS